MAVSAWDVSSVFPWPLTRPPGSEPQAESLGTGEDAVARANAARTVVPSSERRAPWVSRAPAWGQDRQHGGTRWGWRRANTRPQVSCEGMPCGKVRKVGSQACGLVPKRALSWTPAPPVRRVHTAMTRISSRGCCLVRSRRGSSNVWQCSTIEALTGLPRERLLCRGCLAGAA
jgi:hypothetical protein